MYKYLLITGFMMLFAFAATAQQQHTDTASVTKKDTVKKASGTAPGSFAPPIKKEKVYHPDTTHSPHKAVMHSLMIPGWGQLYNHRWWKVPIIYTGIGLLASAVIFNQRYYNEFNVLAHYYKSGVAPVKGDAYYDEYIAYTSNQVPAQNIYDALDSYRRNRDLSILGILGAWGIQAIDAYIDAKFIHSYSVDNNFGFKVSPGLINQPVYAQTAFGSYIPAVKVTFTF
ncbi:DUF5683 domain-containing protein [Mucilaginibacter sp. KACC 22773]|jgi:hypothetical protein|uniref:DUF5683 domain-containing protein n=1 Tax=Mucilaginibacter sp. KACC 22773 TaxID=3025671 RepID=UPI0023671279|nr:DUF5683 domain-containing protein [Mucilaginibacter sp. KACC 22773]WDF78741.1 DUF5683 domain-containing protein [Mucilaginibacter sp. KACC 22773]